jgi:hypothetical protein
MLYNFEAQNIYFSYHSAILRVTFTFSASHSRFYVVIPIITFSTFKKYTIILQYSVQ